MMVTYIDVSSNKKVETFFGLVVTRVNKRKTFKSNILK